jgi:pyruvate,water dikinase
VIQLLAQHGLRRGDNDLEVIMMCELPSNAVLADAFLDHSMVSLSDPTT